MNAEAGPSIPKQPKRTTKETHPNLPPGLILDENGKVCKICNSWQDWGKVVKKNADGSGISKGSGNGKAKAGGMGGFAAMMSGGTKSTASAQSATPTSTPPASTTSHSPSPAESDRSSCPPDTISLGRSTWTFLHTTAAYYPLQAPPKQQENMRSLLSSLSLLYPCQPCAEDFQVKIKENPPDLSGRLGLSRWLCERHNEVNEKLGKERFGCDWDNLDRRWKDGPSDGSCD